MVALPAVLALMKVVVPVTRTELVLVIVGELEELLTMPVPVTVRTKLAVALEVLRE
jgi:hypothetical protein